MKFHRLLILAAAAWAGSMIYKLHNTLLEPDEETGHSFYSNVTGTGSLAQTVRSSIHARGSGNPKEYSSHGATGKHKDTAVEDITPPDPQLLQAAAKGDKTLVEQRLSQHVRVDSRDDMRRTPLMYASWNGYDDIANRLIAAGAN